MRPDERQRFKLPPPPPKVWSWADATLGAIIGGTIGFVLGAVSAAVILLSP